MITNYLMMVFSHGKGGGCRVYDLIVLCGQLDLQLGAEIGGPGSGRNFGCLVCGGITYHKSHVLSRSRNKLLLFIFALLFAMAILAYVIGIHPIIILHEGQKF